MNVYILHRLHLGGIQWWLFTFAQDSAVIDSLIKIFLTACLFLGGQIHRDPVATYFPENLKNIGILELSSSNG
jgi:hypothetical protein